jgi:xylulokinase
MQADMFKTPVTTVNSGEGPALGVAILAGVAAGIYRDVRTACEDIITVGETIKPDGETGAVYDRHYEIYRELYGNLKLSYKKSGSIADES